MVVNCPKCEARLQMDDAKLPARTFTVRCPKCQNIINAQPQSVHSLDFSALKAGGAPAFSSSRFEKSEPSNVSTPGLVDENAVVTLDATPTTDTGDLLKTLIALLQRGVAADLTGNARKHSWDQRQALVCTLHSHREKVARTLTENQYQVFIADNSTEAIERMRENQVQVIVLDTNFDQNAHGAALIKREISALRPADRRRVFLVLLTDATRTSDSHAAFVNHINLIVNYADVETMSDALERALHDFNDLYKDFNKALNVAAAF